ncbi:RNA polymerase-binding protein DksA [Rhodoferax sp.]|uniref:RNA polymerase-binding protein DksA n=1 Tax=Rhodoferax sp. TaxID=50421 RepID=UPI00352113A2
MKAPATRTAKTTPTATKAAKGRVSPVSTQKKPAVPSKSVPKAPAKAVTKTTTKPAAKPGNASSVVSKPVAKKAAPVKKTSAAKAVTAASTSRSATQTKSGKAVDTRAGAAKPAAKTPAPAKALAKVAPAVKVRSESKMGAAHAATVPSSKPARPVATVASAPVAKRPPPAPAPVVVESTPRPLGKRAAKKVMMEQMTQAAVVPTHAPDAVKATFSTMNERVMTPPVPSSIQKDPKRVNNWKNLPVEQLTDPDVQAMPDDEYMNEVQLAFFRRKLSLLKADMLANAGETTEHLREDTVVVPDPADRATIEEEHALELRTRDRERKLLKKIEQAIARIDSGDYGYCEETGEAIGVARLMARPTASLSLEAQQRRELKQKMFGD